MTDQRKTPGPAATGDEGSKQSISPLHYKLLTPRLERLLAALMDAPDGLPREACDSATPCSNSPEYISQLRARLGLCIPCEMRPFVTTDGLPSKYGVYRLTRADRDLLTAHPR